MLTSRCPAVMPAALPMPAAGCSSPIPTISSISTSTTPSARPGLKYRDIPLGRGLKGAFAVSSKGAVWIGDYQEERPAGLFKFGLAAIEALRDGAPLTAGAASAIVAIATYAQGGAVDGAGDLWISRSDVGWGFLEKLDAVSGHLRARYPMPAGIEGIAFDPQGRLWAVCEAGARHLPLRYPFFPLIFRLDPYRLAPAE